MCFFNDCFIHILTQVMERLKEMLPLVTAQAVGLTEFKDILIKMQIAFLLT